LAEQIMYGSALTKI